MDTINEWLKFLLEIRSPGDPEGVNYFMLYSDNVNDGNYILDGLVLMHTSDFWPIQYALGIEYSNEIQIPIQRLFLDPRWKFLRVSFSIMYTPPIQQFKA